MSVFWVHCEQSPRVRSCAFPCVCDARLLSLQLVIFAISGPSRRSRRNGHGRPAARTRTRRALTAHKEAARFDTRDSDDFGPHSFVRYVQSPGSMPGGRQDHSLAMDSSGVIWVFAGNGYDAGEHGCFLVIDGFCSFSCLLQPALSLTLAISGATRIRRSNNGVGCRGPRWSMQRASLARAVSRYACISFLKSALLTVYFCRAL